MTPREQDPRLLQLESMVEALTERVGVLERQVGARAGLGVPSPRPAPARATARPIETIETIETSQDEPNQWWQVGPLRDVSPARLPAVVLAGAGGLALMFGLLFFVWYAVDQGWLAPALRVGLGAAAGLGLLTAAWGIAPRHRAVAGALGGAGLGSWFASWLVARHVHGLVGHAEAFVALALGAAACLVIAGHRRLRIMATLAALAAYITPVATSTGADRLHELMIYQVVLMGALWGLEQLRRWPELVVLAQVGTWALLLGWAAEHLHGRGGEGMLGWSAALLALGTFQAVQSARRGEALQAALRHGVGGVLAWVAITWAAAPHDTPLALCTLAMAAWHLGTFAFLVRDRAPRAVLAVALTLGWLQAFAFAPLWWHDEGIALWWLAMATVAAALVCWRPQWGAVRLWIAPGLGVLGWSLAHEGDPIGLVLGLSAAAGLLVAAAWPKPLEPAVPAEAGLLPEGHRALVWVTAVAGFFAWAFAAHVHLRWPDIQGVPLLVAVPVLAWVVGAAWRPSPVRGQVAIGACIVALGAFGLDADARDTLSLLGPEVGGRLLPGLALALLVAAAVGLVAALRRHAGRRHAGDVLAEAAAAIHDAAGIITAVAIALLAMLTWVAVAPLLTPDLFVAASLLQVGWSVALAAVALGLVVVGLRRDRSTWRRLGIAALFAVAGKVVFVDLAAVALAWRVVSFVGLGACLIAGAWAYGRFEKRLAPSDLAGDPRA